MAKKQKDNAQIEAEESALSVKDEAVKEEAGNALPARVLLQKPFVLSLRMPGRSSGTITRTFQEGQIVYDPEAIELLIQNDAPIEIL